jgi:Fe2+ transport system protein FeoA
MSRTRRIPLRQLGEGQTGRLCASSLEGESGELLCAMGLTADCSLRVCRRGKSCIIKVDGARFGLSRAMADAIYVAVEE